MDEMSKRVSNLEYTILAIIVAVSLMVITLFVALAFTREADFSMEGIRWIFNNNPIIWVIVAISVFFPPALFLVIRKLTHAFNEQQKIIDIEKSRINHVNEFSQELIHGNYEVDCKLDESDTLGDTLVNLRETLKKNEDNSQKIRKAEDERNWIAEGSAHFSETLRNYIHEPDQLSFHVIKDLTKYVNAIQGGFYVLDDSDPYNRFFNLTAFFAYDRRKFADQKIKWGDGLVGTCALEMKIIHLKDVPQEYITVTSGLGEANPNSLIVVPMIYEGEIFGVLEFASFSKFESNQVSLIEKTAESVAATLSAIKTNIRTNRLLEESKAQTQILTSHEEEMRQNMEELQATQEESVRQTQRLVMLEDTLKRNVLQAEFDEQGIFLSGNNLFFSKFEYTSEAMAEGKHISQFIDVEERDAFTNIWNQLITENNPYKGYLKHVTRTCKDLWVMASLSTSLHDDKSIARIMYLGIDATEERSQLEKHEAIAASLNNTSVNLELDINGNMLQCNTTFIDLFKLSEKEIKSMVIFDVISPSETESFNKRWDGIINGKPFAGVIRTRSAKSGDIWLKGSFNITRNMAHETDHVVFVGIDITHEKQLESELHAANDTLKKQERQIKEAEKELTTKLRETKTELMNHFKEVEKVKKLNEKMLEDTADAVITAAQDNRIIFFNKAAETLWQINRQDVMDQDIGILFPESLTEKDDLLASLVRPGDHKITGKRKKSFIIDKNGKEQPVLVLLTKARVDGENAYMAFFQSVEK